MTDLTMQQLRDGVCAALHNPDPLHSRAAVVFSALQPMLDELADLRQRVLLLEAVRDGLPEMPTSSPPPKG